MSLLPDMDFCKYFLPIRGLSCHFLNGVMRKEVSHFDQIKYIICFFLSWSRLFVSFMVQAFCVLSKISLPDLRVLSGCDGFRFDI